MRNSVIERKTAETEINLTLNLDGEGVSKIDTGCGFLNHMLTLFARHGNFDLTVYCKGDIDVDYIILLKISVYVSVKLLKMLSAI